MKDGRRGSGGRHAAPSRNKYTAGGAPQQREGRHKAFYFRVSCPEEALVCVRWLLEQQPSLLPDWVRIFQQRGSGFAPDSKDQKLYMAGAVLRWTRPPSGGYQPAQQAGAVDYQVKWCLHFDNRQGRPEVPFLLTLVPASDRRAVLPPPGATWRHPAPLPSLPFPLAFDHLPSLFKPAADAWQMARMSTSVSAGWPGLGHTLPPWYLSQAQLATQGSYLPVAHVPSSHLPSPPPPPAAPAAPPPTFTSQPSTSWAPQPYPAQPNPSTPPRPSYSYSHYSFPHHPQQQGSVVPPPAPFAFGSQPQVQPWPPQSTPTTPSSSGSAGRHRKQPRRTSESELTPNRKALEFSAALAEQGLPPSLQGGGGHSGSSSSPAPTVTASLGVPPPPQAVSESPAAPAATITSPPSIPPTQPTTPANPAASQPGDHSMAELTATIQQLFQSVNELRGLQSLGQAVAQLQADVGALRQQMSDTASTPSCEPLDEDDGTL